MDADYVIVGAGSGGCVVANRLSANPRNRVVLIEAGEERRDLRLMVPAALVFSIGNPRFDWCFVTEPDPSRNGRSEGWARGKALGGTSVLNGMLYLRGQRQDFDLWAQQGNRGWSYEEVLPYFRRSETNTEFRDDYHGADGPLYVSEMPSRHPLAETFARAAEEIGIPRNPDANGAVQEGVTFPQGTMINGRRWSAADAYIRPARGRPNLTIVTGAQARRLLVEGDRVVGVEFERRGRIEQARAGREVVLAAGALATPHLLLHSGIGPGEALRAFGIETRLHLPGVGQNLIEHPAAPLGYYVDVPTNNMEARPHRMAWNGLKWLLARRGPAANMLSHAMAFVRSRPGLEAPDLQIYFLPQGTAFRDGKLHFMTRPAVGSLATLCRPASRGDVRLRSPDPRVPLAIHPNMLGASSDVESLVEGIGLVRRIFAASAFRPHLQGEFLPGAENGTPEQLRAYVRAQARPSYHPVGTCKMGTDPLAVLDSQLRVRGMRGLSVADASIMPTHVSGNPNAAIVMIGEKASDLILARAAA